MPVFYRGKRMSWYIPGMDPRENINLDPQTFNPDMLPGNEIRQGGDAKPLAKIPRIPGRISIRKDGYVELIISRYYDKEAKQSRNRKEIIGSAASDILPGMMMTNDTYYEYFDIHGNLVNDPMKKEAQETEKPAEEPFQTEESFEQELQQAEKVPQQAEVKPKPKPIIPQQQLQQTRQNQTEEKPTEPNIDEVLRRKEQDLKNLNATIRKRQKELEELDEEIEDRKEELYFQTQDVQKEHIRLLSYILDHIMDTVKVQAAKKPGVPMSLKQIRSINEILSELKEFFTGCETEDYLHLAEEPDPDNDNPGTTNGEMAILLGPYQYTISAFLNNYLHNK